MSCLRRISYRYRVYTAFVARFESRGMTKKITQRTGSETRKNSTHSVKNQIKFDAERSWRHLERRVKNIEDRMANPLEEEHRFALHVEKDRIAKLPKKRGPKTISSAELDSRLRPLNLFLESQWPELEPMCGPKPNLRVLKKALIGFAKSVAPARVGTVDDHRAAAQRLLSSFDQLAEFLTEHQDRFAGNPRQIANATAGYPDIRFWTSLKRCQQMPFQVDIHPRAIKSYIQRKHPTLYKKLSENPGTPELAAFWHRYRTKDRVLIGLNASDLERLWKMGIPGELNAR